MTPWQAYGFICACLAKDDSGCAGQDFLAQADVDWPAVLAVADAELLLPALYGGLRDKELLGGLDAEIRDLLGGLYRLNLERNQRILATLTRAEQVFKQAGIKAVWLKGGACLAAGVFPDPGAVMLKDLDVLIAKPRLGEAVEALAGAGWKMSPCLHPAWHGYHIVPYHHLEAEVPVEIHFALAPRPRQALLPAGEVLARAVDCAGPGQDLLVPCPTHLVLHNLIEAQSHLDNDPADRVSRKRLAFTHICQRYDQGIDWLAIVLAFDKCGEAQSLINACLSAQFLFSSPLPEGVRPNARLRLAWAANLEREFSHYTRHGLMPAYERCSQELAKLGQDLAENQRLLERGDTALRDCERLLELRQRTSASCLNLAANCVSLGLKILPEASLANYLLAGLRQGLRLLRDSPPEARLALLRKPLAVSWWREQLARWRKRAMAPRTH